MAKLTGHYTEQQLIETSNGTLVLTAGATIRSEGEEALFEAIGQSGNTFKILGSVIALPTGPSPGVAALVTNGANSTVEIGKTGLLSGALGIFAFGADTEITNAGTILATTSGSGGVGIDINSFGNSATISNSGTVSGRIGILLLTSDAEITNEKGGRIIGHEVGVQMDSTGVGNSLTNFGTIMAVDPDDFAIQGGDDGDKVVNKGTILGKIDLGDGDDTFDFRGGLLDSVVAGGEGDDTLITKKASVVLSEQADDGIDTVKSTVGYTLGDNVEQLILLGKKTASATGNTGDNVITGNTGRNLLVGLEGEDQLSGGKGTDTLVGGADADTFILTKGGAKDTVTDFIDGEDFIRVDGYSNFNGPEDVAAHVKDKGDDVWIVMSRKDILILRDVDATLITGDDFVFNV